MWLVGPVVVAVNVAVLVAAPRPAHVLDKPSVVVAGAVVIDVADADADAEDVLGDAENPADAVRSVVNVVVAAAGVVVARDSNANAAAAAVVV